MRVSRPEDCVYTVGKEAEIVSLSKRSHGGGYKPSAALESGRKVDPYMVPVAAANPF